jgi:putative ABC transport system ATP-binding protein
MPPPELNIYSQKVDAQPIIELRDVHKLYTSAAGDFQALKGINLNIHAGDFVSIIGKSGSGKSTLLNMITGIDRPSSGVALVNGAAVNGLNENQMAGWPMLEYFIKG